MREERDALCGLDEKWYGSIDFIQLPWYLMMVQLGQNGYLQESVVVASFQQIAWIEIAVTFFENIS